MKSRWSVRILSVLLTGTAILGMPVYAEQAETAQVLVIVTEQQEELAREVLTVTDTDGDGILTVSDTLYLLHDLDSREGAEASIEAPESELVWERVYDGCQCIRNDVPVTDLLEPVASEDTIVFCLDMAAAETEPAAEAEPPEQSQEAQIKVGDNIVITNADDASTEQKDQNITFEIIVSREGSDNQGDSSGTPVEGVPVSVNGVPTQMKTNQDGSISIVVSDGALKSTVTPSQVQTDSRVQVINMDGNTPVASYVSPTNGNGAYSPAWQSGTLPANDGTIVPVSEIRTDTQPLTEPPASGTDPVKDAISPDTGDAFGLAAAAALIGAAAAAAVTVVRRRRK